MNNNITYRSKTLYMKIHHLVKLQLVGNQSINPWSVDQNIMT